MTEAHLVVPAPAERVFTALRDVHTWPSYLDGLEAITPIGHHRYRLTITFARQRHDVDVVVSVDHAERRVSWRALHRPAFDGRWRVAEVDSGHARVSLALHVEPQSLSDSVAEMLGMGGWHPEHDLQRLSDVLTGSPGVPVAAGSVTATES